MNERLLQAVEPEAGVPLIELCGITKTYGHGQSVLHALRDVALRIEEGDFMAVMGPSGSGKSTCMNILGGLDTPTSGSYRFKGVEVGGLSRDQRARLRRHYLGFVFQGFNLLKRTSALENVELPLIYRKLPAGTRREMALKALESVGLKGWERHTPESFPAGGSSASPLPGPLSRNRPCFWPTSPPGIWIRRAAADHGTAVRV